MIVPPWLTCAEKEVGVMEIPGVEHNERILEYHRATTLRATTDEVPWCSSFVCWCLEEVGMRSTRSAAARSYLQWGVPISPAPYGAIAVLRRGAGEGSQGHEVLDAPGHVGFLIWISLTHVALLGGNQNDCVGVSMFSRTLLIGTRWVHRQ